MENRVDATITIEDLAAIGTALTTIQAKLPFLIDLDADERASLFKMGPRSQSFVRAAINVAEQNIDILPRKLEPADLRADIVLFDQLSALRPRFEKMVELIDDTAMLAGAEAMAGALVVYDCVRKHGKGEALDASMDDLARRFKRRSQPETAPEDEAPEKPDAQPPVA